MKNWEKCGVAAFFLFFDIPSYQKSGKKGRQQLTEY